jgi:hypothetical protein
VQGKMRVSFRGKPYELILTDHAQLQMELRGLDTAVVAEVVETGTIKPKAMKNKYWVYKKVKGRKDDLVALSFAIESPKLIVVTTMVNGSPE